MNSVTRVTPAESRMVLMGADGPKEGKILRNKFECKLCGKHKGGVSYEIHDYMICDDCVKDLSDARSATGFTAAAPVDFGTEGEEMYDRRNTPSRTEDAFRSDTRGEIGVTEGDILTPPVNSEGDVIEDAPTDMYTVKEDEAIPADDPPYFEGESTRRKKGRK